MNDPENFIPPPTHPLFRDPKEFTTKTSDSKTVFNTGAHRDTNQGKPRYDLIPVAALKRLALKYQQGAEAYGERNWEKGMPQSRLYESLLRHIFDYRAGDRTEDHLAAAAWNIFALLHFEETAETLALFDLFIPADPLESSNG